MFGEWTGLILQFTITLVIVLGLIAVAYWLVRRYSAGGLGRIGRGRVPRLAVIDAMAVDGRRRLVLVRRDNVEHLILIGGPTDLVVEPAIQRTRTRPAARPASAAPAAPMVEPEPAPPENPPIPFPQSRIHQQAPAAAYQPDPYQPAPAPVPFQPAPAAAVPAYTPPAPQPIERPFTPLRRANQPQAVKAEPAAAPIPEPAPHTATVVQFEPMTEAIPAFRESPVEEAEPEDAPAFMRRIADGNGQPPLDFSGLGTGSPFPETAASDDTAAKVNDLEREMARLLGEITAKRPT